MKKGQVALEFVFMMLVIVVLVTAMAWVSYGFMAGYSEDKNMKRMQELGYSLQNEVILASNVEPGYSRTLSIPDIIDGAVVNISGTENEIIISYKGNDLLFSIPRSSGAFKTGTNTVQRLQNGSISIN